MPRPRTISLRCRLALGYLGLIALLLVVLGAYLTAALNSFLLADTRSLLQAQLHSVDATLHTVPQSQSLAALAPELVREASVPGVLVAVLSAQGSVLDQSPGPPPPAVSPDRSSSGSRGNARSLGPTERTDAGHAVALPVVAAPPPEGDTFTITDGTPRYAVLSHRINGNGTTLGSIELLCDLSRVDALVRQFLLLYAAGGAIALLIAGLSGSSLTKRGLRPLQRITETCRALARGDLSRRSRLPLGKDEIGTLGLAFDEMAERLEASFTAQRIFVADAAHELRTPLATIAGFTDLLLRGARDDPAVANQALRTMLSEEDRMLRLLERMLALARLEAAPPPRREHVDIAALTAALAAETAALAPDLRVRYEGLSAATVEASGDELRQALLNLADNARKYTPQGAGSSS